VIGRVSLQGLRCQGRHGLTSDAEPDVRFTVDVGIDLDLEAVARSDAYADVIDLAELAATVRDTVGGPPRQLIETVTVALCRAILERFPRVATVSVRLAKAEPPGLEAAEEAVEVSLSRS
jgi:7,8-dihydroneopterin aldolase/epimerase/oxygenase